MDFMKSFFPSCLLLLYSSHVLSELLVQNLIVQSSVLTWTYKGEDDGLIFIVQYNKSSGDWDNLCNCTESQFNFTINAEKFYGKSFRVRAQSKNLTSDWVVSKKVQCEHIHICVPQVIVKAEPDTVRLWMTHRDESMKSQHGGHITFVPLYWESSNPSQKQQLDMDPNDNTLVSSYLASGKEYCFQVQYLLYHNLHGKPSQEICKVIPETSIQRKLRIILFGALLVAVLAVLLTGLYLLYKHKEKIKQLFHPPLVIPEHFETFLFTDSHQQPNVCSSSDVSESFDLISLQEVEEGQINAEETSSAT